jgi:simple sugar transport system permease protein
VLGVFVSVDGLTESFTRAIPLLLASVGLCLPFKMNFWNIGAEGQLFMGAFAATAIVFLLPESSAFVLLGSMIIAGFVFGGIWGLIPAYLKARLETNEVLTTLMLNFVAILWVDYLVYGPWRDPEGFGFPLTPMFPLNARLPWIPGTRIHAGLIVGVVCAVLVYVLLARTRLGYELKVTGESRLAAKYAGIDYVKLTLVVMFISGGLAGLAGMGLVSGIVLRLRHGISPGYGYSAIIIAWLARLNPLACVPVSVLFGGLLVAGDALQIGLGLAFATTSVFQALILLFVVGGEVLTRYKVVLTWE